MCYFLCPGFYCEKGGSFGLTSPCLPQKRGSFWTEKSVLYRKKGVFWAEKPAFCLKRGVIFKLENKDGYHFFQWVRELGVARSWLFLYKGCYNTSLKSCTSHFTPLILLVQGVLLCCLSDCLCVHSCYHLNLWNIIIDMHIKFISAMHLGIC